MATFTTLYTATTISNQTTGETVNVIKVQKDGTKRTFFRPVTAEGKKVGDC